MLGLVGWSGGRGSCSGHRYPAAIEKMIGARFDDALDQLGGEVQEIHGINGSVGIIYAVMDTELAGLRFPVNVAWAQLEEVPPLLGRAGVFDHFDITFQQARHVVLFRPLSG